MSSVGSKIPWPVIGLLFVVSLGFLLYPVYGNLYNQYLNARAVRSYEQTVEDIDDSSRDAAWAAACEYNVQHRVNVAADPFGGDSPTAKNDEYEGLLSLAANGVMASLEIPKIGQLLAVYHGTSSEALEKGVGHVQGTSLPVGGLDTHCVIAGHRGLAQALIFTDLDQMRTGDQFYFHVLGQHLAYEVESVDVVRPEEMDVVAIQVGKDLASLVTCTPYGVNTHRLIVRGHRVPYVPRDNTSLPEIVALFSPEMLVLIVIACVVALGLVTRGLSRLRNRFGKEESESC